jgi:hypothetical protein
MAWSRAALTALERALALDPDHEPSLQKWQLVRDKLKEL